MDNEKMILSNLKQFLTLMYTWEKNANAELEKIDITDENFYSEQVNKRAKIFNEFVINKKRKKGGVDDFSVGFPEKYNPNELDKIEILEVTTKSAHLIVNKVIYSNVTKKRKYAFIKVDNNWLLDEVYEWSTHDNKWVLSAI
ncbi:NTF2 fold immunity protein [Neisseria wadsworthii]|uniref:NTF2 fold immunity protein domain-containing protein n=1 Tax=Neisseria wadsworthii 9715 TaxID=1030841 RepID=G4CMX1_9NEIS|nr:NTF2 fold immunity protein [Neisseria wadsworthii]EGZ50939.1 hypothetical protein HMPREF9370_0430 [Neisseria wadsworthii 9715]QMT36434.1 hypothetical protein H3L96_04215 [Neisseria wadsworthii]